MLYCLIPRHRCLHAIKLSINIYAVHRIILT